MIQIKNTQRVVKELDELTNQFQKALKYIDSGKNDAKDIFRDVRTGKDNLFEVTPFAKDSASNSVYFGVKSTDARFFPKPVTAFVKAYPNTVYNEGLRVETCMYKNFVASQLKSATPNIVHYYGSAAGFPLGKHTPGEIYQMGQKAAVQNKVLNHYRVSKAVMNFTEYLPMAQTIEEFFQKDDLSMTFASFLEGRVKNATEKDLAELLFQIIYTLNLFELLKIHHNDIHTSNILVVKNNTGREFLYGVNVGKRMHYTYMKPNFIAKIFDYDRGYSDDLLCYPNSSGFLPCYKTRQGASYKDCYEKDRTGYDLLRFLTSQSYLRGPQIRKYFGDDLVSAMSKFLHMSGAGNSELSGIKVEKTVHYLTQLCKNANKNGWFETTTDYVAIVQKYRAAEFYTADNKFAPTIRTPPVILYSRGELEKMSMEELKNLIQQAGLTFEPTKETLVEFILKEKLAKPPIPAAKSPAALTEGSLKKKKIGSLKEILRQRKLAVAGRKSDLIRRILGEPAPQAVSPMGVDPRKALCKAFINDLRKGQMYAKNPYTGRKMLARGALAKKIHRRCIIEFQDLVLAPRSAHSTN